MAEDEIGSFFTEKDKGSKDTDLCSLCFSLWEIFASLKEMCIFVFSTDSILKLNKETRRPKRCTDKASQGLKGNGHGLRFFIPSLIVADRAIMPE
ncbi:MAG TPA: hypothetical protein VM802_27300 [Chitinophaga sp.]|uniref:hypothetical protein n=1 Tax=Chitinophaga sp. TaxID=1869181 RepID=UPI002CEA5887|nr:hypothetical protein [Chitinophaga sp.]HVI48605.1 hypothetical protein [Chitinophaga sp.]